MTSNPPIILVDVNVWLDLYIPGREGHDIAYDLLALAEEQNALLCFPAHASLDVFQRSIANSKEYWRRSGQLTEAHAKAAKAFAWDCVNEMQQVATAIPIDSFDMSRACKFRDTHDDFEDDLVLAACQRSRANYLVTNDRKLMSRSSICAKTPAEMLELMREGRAQGWPPSQRQESAEDYLLAWLGNR